VLALAGIATLTGCFGTTGLYAPDAGFAQARTGSAPATPIRVGALPGVDVNDVISVWNGDAGRTIAVADDANPQVTFVGDLTASSRAAWVQPLPDRFGPYTSCVIHYDPARLTSTEMGISGLRHEFGHCLGFRDIEFFPAQNHSDNQQCNAPSQPNYNGTALRMSYCFYWKPQQWGGIADRASLFNARYGVRNT
jgi:hypothetical protein